MIIGQGGTRPSECMESMAHMIDISTCKDGFEGLSDLGVENLVKWGYW